MSVVVRHRHHSFWEEVPNQKLYDGVRNHILQLQHLPMVTCTLYWISIRNFLRCFVLIASYWRNYVAINIVTSLQSTTIAPLDVHKPLPTDAARLNIFGWGELEIFTFSFVLWLLWVKVVNPCDCLILGNLPKNNVRHLRRNWRHWFCGDVFRDQN